MKKAARARFEVLKYLGEYLLVLTLLALLFGFFDVERAWGRDGGGAPTLPAAQSFPTPAGILFPGLNSAAGINPAALTSWGKATSFQLAYSPPLQSGDPQGAFASIATASRSVGIGAAYDGDFTSGATTHGAIAGIGATIAPLSFGVGLRDTNVQSGFNPAVDIGLIIGGNGEKGRGLTGGAVFYHVENSPQLDVGLGYAGGKKYSIEGNVLLPPFSSLSGSTYVCTLSAALATGAFSFLFRTSYYTLPSTFQHTIGLSAWVSQRLNLLLQFTTNRRLTAGLTIGF